MVDIRKAEQAIKMLLEAVGEDPERAGLKDTPSRVAKMYAEILQGNDQTPQEALSKTFEVGTGELILEKDVTFYSLCEHHLMPFAGKVHIAYLPDGKVVGLSKLARTVEIFARRLQLQEQMTDQIAEAIDRYLAPRGVMVVAEAEHTCMTMRGVKKPGAKTLTYAVRGAFARDEHLRATVFGLIK